VVVVVMGYGFIRFSPTSATLPALRTHSSIVDRRVLAIDSVVKQHKI
jgi:hypothetical protein